MTRPERHVPAWVSRYGLTILLALALAGMVALVAVETHGGTELRLPLTGPSAMRAPSAPLALLPPFALPPLDPSFKEIVERPLFVPTRRPSPAGSAAAVTVMRKGQYRLTGTSVGSQLSTAFLVDKSSGKSLRVIKGAEVVIGGGITVDSVAPTRVILRQGMETEELILTTASSQQVAAASPVTAGAGANPAAAAATPSAAPPQSNLQPINANARPGGPSPANFPPNPTPVTAAPWVQPGLPAPLPAPGIGENRTVTPTSPAVGVTPPQPANESTAPRRRRFPNSAPAQ